MKGNEAQVRDPGVVAHSARSVLGGVLMGLANLVPGISGGTMLLAAGIYPRFIGAIAEVTTLRFRPRSLLVLGLVVVSAVAAIVLLAGPTKDLVVERRWIMYSLFIGLTLGGVPLVWRMARPATPATWVGFAGGLVVMALLAIAQQRGMGEGGAPGSSLALLLLAGVAGASAMILPGVSGAYLLLVLGQYETILASIDRLKDAAQSGNLDGALAEWVVIVPVGVGVVIGIVGVSNLLKWLLVHQRKATLGALLGLLVGAVVGLWPFQKGVEPTPGSMFRGEVVTEEVLLALGPEDWPVEYFRPSPGQAVGALALIGVGFLVTLGISRLGGREEESASSSS